MIEFALFHQETCDRFCEYLRGRGLAPAVEITETHLNLVLPEEIADEVLAEIEDYYDDLLAITEALVDAEDEGSQLAAGLTVNLSDGRRVQASVPPVLLDRVLGVLSFEELGQLVDAVVQAVERPDDRPLCQRGADEPPLPRD